MNQVGAGRSILCEKRRIGAPWERSLTGAELIELRRWVIGPERGSKGRRRGLSARLADLASYDEAGGKAIALPLDIGSTESVEAVFDAAEKQVGPSASIYHKACFLCSNDECRKRLDSTTVR